MIGNVPLPLVFWRGRMQKPIILGETWPIFGISIIPPVLNIAFTIIARYWDILWIVLLSAAATTLVSLAIYLGGRGLVMAWKSDTSYNYWVRPSPPSGYIF